MAAQYLTLQDLRARWHCGKTFAYEAIAEMQANGYLTRLWIGRSQRIGLASIERWELEHSDQPAKVIPITAVPKPVAPAKQLSRDDLRSMLLKAV
jgi:MarR-like DNA-binding transcriptional regulator SgrR of sgrS sRNA